MTDLRPYRPHAPAPGPGRPLSTTAAGQGVEEHLAVMVPIGFWSPTATASADLLAADKARTAGGLANAAMQRLTCHGSEGAADVAQPVLRGS